MISKTLIGEFEQIVGRENVFSDKTDRVTYSYDAAVVKPVIPALAVRPTSGDALSGVVRLCNENRLPLTVRGAGTNLSGGTIPSPEGVVVLTNALADILEINQYRKLPVSHWFTYCHLLPPCYLHIITSHIIHKCSSWTDGCQFLSLQSLTSTFPAVTLTEIPLVSKIFFSRT